MRIAICDDDRSMQAKLAVFIEETFKDLDMLVDGYSSGKTLLLAMEKQPEPYDLILLDIEMRGLNGIETAKRVRKLSADCYIVFITSHDEFALTGYEVQAFRYLIKPVNPEKLQEAISAVRAELADRFMLHAVDGATEAMVRAKDVYYVEAQDKRVRLVLAAREVYDRANLDEYARLLENEDFFRVHRSYLVNFRYVAFMDGKEIELVNGDRVPVSRLRKKAFKEAFQAYVKRTAR